METTTARNPGRTAAVLLLVALAAAMACDRGIRAVPASGGAAAGQDSAVLGEFTWPDSPSEIAVLEIEGLGEIRIGLYRQVAPKSVAHFVELSQDGVYDGTLFHRVIPDFMIQGGDPNSTMKERHTHGMGGTRFKVEDEYSAAPHDRGVVSLANRGGPGTAGSQFFIVHQDSHHLDGQYTAFGRVIEGMEVVDAITELEIDTHGRWGPKHHPIEEAKMSAVRIEAGGEATTGSEIALSE